MSWLGDHLVRIPAILLALGLHEWSHAYVADRSGDPTPRADGRLSLDLVTHLDPLGTICLFFGPIGWARPVMITPSYLEDPERDQVRVAMAGPLMNFLIAAAAIFVIGVLKWWQPSWFRASFGPTIWEMLWWIPFLNITLGMFNLLPIPPLDGSKVVFFHLEESVRQAFRSLQPLCLLVVLQLCYMRAFDPLYEFGLACQRYLLGYGLWVHALVLIAAAWVWGHNARIFQESKS